ncbi:MAG: pyridoxal phosphate-dependent decarboxylase family protein [Actinomycetales bacterium]
MSEQTPYDAALDTAARHARAWLASVPERPVAARAGVDEIAKVLGNGLPDGPTAADQVVDELATAADPGLAAMGSGRWFGFVIGGTLPAALGADWLTSAWDQNSGLRQVTPAVTALGDVAARWLLELLQLPAGCSVGWATGATTANFAGLAAARYRVLERAGWNVERDGLQGAPRVRVFAGEEVHSSVELGLRMLGLGEPVRVRADAEGRMRPDALAKALAEGPEGGPVVVVLQAGNVHSGAFDEFAALVPLAHQAGAWVHVDGAFGLWAAASPPLRALTVGMAGADSWATDAHKTLNVPYDSGVVLCADPVAHRAALGVQGPYLIQDDAGDPSDFVPELSRRGREIVIWAALRSLGRSGVEDLMAGLCRAARRFADGVSAIPGARVLNDVVYTQVCVGFGSDELTQRVVRRVLDDGTAWMSGSRWHDQAVLRVSVSNAATTDEDVDRSVDALARIVGEEST